MATGLGSGDLEHLLMLCLHWALEFQNAFMCLWFGQYSQEVDPLVLPSLYWWRSCFIPLGGSKARTWARFQSCVLSIWVHITFFFFNALQYLVAARENDISWNCWQSKAVRVLGVTPPWKWEHGTYSVPGVSQVCESQTTDGWLVGTGTGTCGSPSGANCQKQLCLRLT